LRVEKEGYNVTAGEVLLLPRRQSVIRSARTGGTDSHRRRD
jgi:hypothetical protein